MKHFTIASLSRLPFALPSSKQAPFPGKYPTRVAFFMPDGTTYIGKPPGTMFNMTQRVQPIQVIEFDRAHRILDSKEKHALSKLGKTYHPWAVSYVLANQTRFAMWFAQLLQRGPNPFHPELVSYIPK